MSESYVPIRPVNPTTPANCVHNDVNNVRVGVSHSKYSKTVDLSAYPCNVKDNGIVSILVTSGECVTVESMPRLNRKRLELLQSATQNELSCRTGRAWDLVQKLCEKRGYAVVTDPSDNRSES